MQKIGERLEDARKRKGVSIREAAELTKVRGDYLQKFEASNFEIDLPPLYLRGFVRTYAKFLGLDPERIVEDLDEQLRQSGKPFRREQREPLARLEIATPRGPANEERTEPVRRVVRREPILNKRAIALLTIAALAVTCVALLISMLASRRAAKPAAPKATPTAIAPAETAQTLVLTALDGTRVQVIRESDKAVLFDGSLQRGESKTFQKLGRLSITIEVGKNIRMEVNGRKYDIPFEGFARFTLD